MKTNGLIGKKAKCARAAWRTMTYKKRGTGTMVKVQGQWVRYQYKRLLSWVKAQRGRK